MSLSNYQLVLLDNLIYLGKFEKLANNVKEEVNVGEVIDDLTVMKSPTTGETS